MPESEGTATGPQLVRARPEESELLTRIAQTAKGHWGYPETWMEVWREEWTIRPESIQTRWTQVARWRGQPVGFYQLHGIGRSLRLDHLWVLPDAMGRGVGRSLYRDACEHGFAMGWETMRIVSDPHAEGFYLRMGARRIGVERTVILGTHRELPVLLAPLGALR